MGLAELAVASLATWQAVEVWRHGEIVAPWRQWFRDRREARQPLGWLASLLSCPWCLSVWAAAAVVAALGLSDLLPPPWHLLARWPVWALAVSRLANLGNDLAHDACRTPKDYGIAQDVK